MFEGFTGLTGFYRIDTIYGDLHRNLMLNIGSIV